MDGAFLVGSLVREGRGLGWAGLETGLGAFEVVPSRPAYPRPCVEPRAAVSASYRGRCAGPGVAALSRQ